MSKICWTCNFTKDLSLFTKDKSKRDGYSGRCASCSRIANKAAIKDRESQRASARKYKANNPEKILAYQNSHKEETKERQAKWAAENSTKDKARRSAYRKANVKTIRARINEWGKKTGKTAAYSAAYKASKLKATPIWANQFFIDEAYHLAKLRTAATGFVWEVDHFYPLQSPIVCGLHVEQNLQVIPYIDNRLKGNKVVCHG